MKLLSLFLVLITGAFLLNASRDMPDWGDPNSPASRHLSPHFIGKTFEETSVPNLVTAILADYRGFDTMLETIVIFSAGIAIMAMLGSGFGASSAGTGEKQIPVAVRKDLIVQTSCRLLIPIIQLFALYVVIHGHHSPGGGFQGGVILGSSLIFVAIAYDLKIALKLMSERTWMLLASFGVLLYAGVGTGSLFLGGNFLDYASWSKVLPLTPVEAHSLGMLVVEVGVAFTVMSIMFAIYAELASGGSLRRGI